MRIEGSGASQLVSLIRTLGHNSDVNVELATVTSAPPDLKIRIDHMSVDLEKDDLIVAQSLTRHKRQVNLKSEGKAKISASNLKLPSDTPPSGLNVAVNYTGNAALVFSAISLSNADFTAEKAELEFLDELKKGDRVLVMGIKQDQTYVVLERVVTY
ncbi:DUF2577 family protein [Paenibacillus kobensis]|uniref:DUF2577 family protein n=1 Tax=Paenibacillus kobensis TaxID=59841 RepID=UPI000FD6D350|nr:DUF2577 family protein [Paenibacillus kobensis]